MPIECRHRTYFAYLDVPKDVRKRLGRRVYRQTLKTDSRSVAERRAAPLISQWKSLIAKAREEPDHNDARYWRDALRHAKDDEDRTAIMERIDMMADDIGAINVENVGDRPSSDPEAQRFYAEATGAAVPTDEHLNEWFSSLQVQAKTAGMRRATIARLSEKFPMLRDISRREVRRWVTELMTELKPATVQRMMTDCRTYWAYLATIEAVSEESAPFDRLGLKVKRASWQPFEPSDMARLLNAAIDREDLKLADLIRLAMYTGARREELCALPVADVKSDRFLVAAAKTQAGVREIPIHRELAETMARLVGQTTDGFVLSGLKPNKNGDRGDVLGKRFTRLKRDMAFGDRQVFHSIRGTVITMLERAEVPEGTVQDIVGHERSTLTGSTYSGKSTFEMRRAALAKLNY
ncbi:MAG: tyrosine-type recombinase/integrase [Proteobacteria bacterium]|nr:tyrosine-type recombinase/integrase [Pseudomonadota bacterium]